MPNRSRAGGEQLTATGRFALTGRILAVNILPLLVMGGGLFYLDGYRTQLINERFKLARIEAQGWARLRQLGAPPLRRVISLGGGARNPQWRQLRQLAIGLPVLSRPGLAPALGMARLALSALTTAAPKMEEPAPPPEIP